MTATNATVVALAAPPGDDDSDLRLRQILRSIWIDRDLSWLDFNERVLAEAMDSRNPLLERAKFLAIFTSNTDEFFMKRIDVLHEQSDASTMALRDQLRAKLIGALERQAQCWKEQILPSLAKPLPTGQGSDDPVAAEATVAIRNWEDLTSEQQSEANSFFDKQVYPALTPLIINLDEDFPFLSNLSTSLVFTVQDSESSQVFYARVKVPSGMRNWLPVTPKNAPQPVYVRLHQIMRVNLPKLYPGMTIGPAALVRLTRGVEVEALEGSSVSPTEEVRRQLRLRRFEPVIRLEFTHGVDSGILELLQNHFKLAADQVYEAPDDLDCYTLFELAGLEFPALKDKPWVPVIPPLLRADSNMFNVIRASDVLVHHPYESFDGTVERFIEQAASDAKVLAIKMTVYRLGDDTPFVHSLIKAAEAGKQVACVIELQARFDEERNLHWASALQEAGAHVTYGVKGLKIHGKTALVVRKENDGLRAFAHIGTGNYHSRTARLYSDLGLFTCDPTITNDVVSLFHHLTGHSHSPAFDKLLVAPHSMRTGFLELVAREIQHKRSGRPARIIAKMNQLEDPEMIQSLCQASTAGVSIDLIIRGFCCLKPGVPDYTENIQVRSIIGRFLEHSRIYYFANGATELVDGEFYIGSADWMHRNLSKRIEVITPITATNHKQRIAEILEIYLNDRRQAWLLNSDGQYSRMQPESDAQKDSGTNQLLMDLAARS